ncbi:MAG: PQ-loop repeat-containing protein [Acidobacteria bacterium]|nr:PQ-loop repeat-containing protein [Acidobacteriota bacterium]
MLGFRSLGSGLRALEAGSDEPGHGADERRREVTESIQWLGFAGMGLVAVAYVPQIVHLARARCTAGVSSWAYLVWSVSASLLLVYAITVRDPVFIALQGYQLLALTSI